ncbi:MAG: hypothetical protein AMXMBFR36_16320 [Acidobacteriota bacterium]
MRISRMLAFVGTLVVVASPAEGGTAAAGTDHSLAIKVDGTVWSWGGN